MKELYLNIMEAALAAYDSKRISEYIRTVEDKGLTEHGFPRLGANMGILMAHGRRLDLQEHFIRIMDICCDQIIHLNPHAPRCAGNDFSVREVCWCLQELEKTGLFPAEQLHAWSESFRNFDPWTGYCEVAPTPDTAVNNWAAFAALSDFVRGKYLGLDTSAFVDHQIASQLLSLDDNGMYKDPNNPMLYDFMTRVLLAAFVPLGYRGEHLSALEAMLEKSAELSLQMQSVIGELPFGGRSNQCLFNEPVLCAYYEIAAAYYRKKGDMKTAGRFKASALSAARCAMDYLSLTPVSHVKNRYAPDSMIGCESYAYFDKYMITVASNAYIAWLFADDAIEPIRTEDSYVAVTGPDFHKVFLSAGGYHLEFDTDADFHYDANGLGRVHKQECPSALCLSVPSPPHPNYRLEQDNPGPMALGSINSAGAPYTLVSSSVDGDAISAVFACSAGEERCRVSAAGVDITFSCGAFHLPVFEYDGETETHIEVQPGCITIRYRGALCRYRFDGEAEGFTRYYNRSGRYRVYHVNGSHLIIEMQPA